MTLGIYVAIKLYLFHQQQVRFIPLNTRLSISYAIRINIIYTGGVGWAATQLAKTVPNVRVIGLSSVSKHEIIKQNGVDIAIDSMNPCWEEAVRNACPDGIDIAIDVTSGDNFRRTQLLVKDLGRAILIGLFILHLELQQQ